MKVQIGQISEQNSETVRTVVRGLINQIPGFSFTNYMTTYYAISSGNGNGIDSLISTDSYKALLDQHWATFPTYKTAFDEMYAGYGNTDGIPKTKLFIKLVAGITAK